MKIATALIIAASLWFQTAALPQFVLAQEAHPTAASTASAPPENEKKSALGLPRLILKNGGYFLVLDPQGMISLNGLGAYGMYASDTRYLSTYELRINDLPPTLLNGTVAEGFAGRFIYGNKAADKLPEQSILLDRQIVILDGITEKLSLTNYGKADTLIKLSLGLKADFADMFEVRGQVRPKRGTSQKPVWNQTDETLKYSYVGVDGKPMDLLVRVKGMIPAGVTENTIDFAVSISRGKSATVELSFQPYFEERPLALSLKNAGSHASDFDTQIAEARKQYASWRDSAAQIVTDDPVFNKLIERAYLDLYILQQPTPKGVCIAAGLPWFAVAFGRDQLITALQMLPFKPEIARNALKVLAAYQGSKRDTFTEEVPGKIMHELRLGEMARTKEIPFIPYYGTVDATPLFLVLLGRYVEWTGDWQLARELWPNAKSALAYLDANMTSGYLRYGGEGKQTLSNQGWKDSGDSIMYADGKLVTPPVALCEVQGYVYEAWMQMAVLSERFGEKTLSVELGRKGLDLRKRFNRDFWIADKQYLALALDGKGRQCAVMASNPGHCIGNGIVHQENKKLITAKLMASDMFSGWGIRTLSSREKAYNPMSYHNGSIWPHDNAMIAEGMSRIGEFESARKILSGLYDTAKFQPDLRLPELFCGFTREQIGNVNNIRQSYAEPIRYPVSCSPQAWAAGSIFQLIAAAVVIRPFEPSGASHVGATVLPNVRLLQLKYVTGR